MHQQVTQGKATVRRGCKHRGAVTLGRPGRCPLGNGGWLGGDRRRVLARSVGARRPRRRAPHSPPALAPIIDRLTCAKRIFCKVRILPTSQNMRFAKFACVGGRFRGPVRSARPGRPSRLWVGGRQWWVLRGGHSRPVRWSLLRWPRGGRSA